MKRRLIIGYGNPFRGDDALGWHVIDRLRQLSLPSDVELMAVHQLTPELTERLALTDWVVFVDACDEPKAPAGRARWHHLSPNADACGSFTHTVSPAALLAMAKLLYRHCPEAYLVTVAGQSFAHHEGLSKAVESRLPDLLRQIQGRLRRAPRPSHHKVLLHA